MALVLASLLWAALPARVRAQQDIWTGGGPNNNWSTGANWAGGVGAAPNDNLIFTGTVQLASNNDLSIANARPNSILFAANAGPFVLGGNAIILGGGGISNNSAFTQTLAFQDFGFGFGGIIIGSQTWSANAGDLHILSNVTLGFAGEQVLTITGAHNVVISGSIGQNGAVGSVVKNGTGTLILGGQNTYTGNTIVNGGLLEVNGSILGNAFVNTGATLGGLGVIGGSVFNTGNVEPGDAPGPLVVKGNYVQAVTGTLTIEFAGLGPYQHGLLAVGGTAQLGGTLELTELNRLKFKLNESVPLLTAPGGVYGTFSNVIDDLARTTILEPTVVYSGVGVALVAKQGSFLAFAQSAGLTPNERSVAGALDSGAFGHGADSLIEYLDGRNLRKLPTDFDRIAPTGLTSVFTMGVALEAVQSLNLQRRTDEIRSGSSGFSAANLAINGNGPSYSGAVQFLNGSAGPDGEEIRNDDGKGMKETKEVAPAENRWGAFLSGTGQWVNLGNTDNARGYTLDSGGFTLGVDYKVCPHFAIGLAAGYTGTTSDLTDHGRVWVNGGKLGLYSTTFAGGWYADAAAFGGYNSYDTRRSSIQGEARGDSDGGEINALLGTGYDFKAGGITFGPTASFNYTYVGLNGFDEHGSLAPLAIHGHDEDSLRTAFGVKASYDWKLGGVIFKPELRAAWQHEYGDTAYSLDSSLASGAGGVFSVNGPRIGRDSCPLGAGFALQCGERCTTYFYYDGELGRTNYHSTAVTGGLRVAF